MIFDLDPGEGLAWMHMQEAAMLMRNLLEALGIESWLKTSGGKGLHLWVPLRPDFDYDTVKRFSEAIVSHMARTLPQRFVAKSGPSNRMGRVFIDYLRNGWVQSTAEAFSARARPGLGVSMPVAWDELDSISSGAHWTIVNAVERMRELKRDPWAAYWKHPQRLRAAMDKLGFDPGKKSARPKPG